MATTRSIKDAIGWFWVDKPVLNRIRELCNSEQMHPRPYVCIYNGLAEIASRRGKETFQATIDEISDLSGYGRVKIIKSVRWLQQHNLIAVKKAPVWGPNEFTLLSARDLVYSEGTLRSSASEHHKRKEKKERKAKEHLRGVEAAEDDNYSVEFLAFWQAYPIRRRENKPQAFQAWQDLQPDSDLQKLIIEHLGKWSRSQKLAETETRYISFPANWLKQSRWLDEIPDDDDAEFPSDYVPASGW